MNQNKKITVLITDDHEVVRAGVKSVLTNSNEITIIAEADNGGTAIELIEKLLPDVAILDISMPVIRGIAVLEYLAQKQIPTKIIVLSMYNEPEYVIKTIELGAKSYLIKNTDLNDIKKAILQVAKGDYFFPPTISAIIAQDIHKPKNELVINLSKREREVLNQIVNGYSNKQIATNLNISDKTVAIHRSNIIRKTNAKNTADLVKIALENKLL